MSVTVCRSSSTVPLPLEKEGFGSILLMSASNTASIIKNQLVKEIRPPEQLDIWSSVRARKAAKQEPKLDDEPYIHPLVRRSSSLLNEKSLDICTESLGSETGSDNHFSSDDDMDYLFSNYSNKQQIVPPPTQQQQQEYADDNDGKEESDNDDEYVEVRKKELVTVNYHCSIGRRTPARSFPPPLRSISRRDGPCLQMRPRREDGRLVVEAVTVPSQNYLHAERQGGRLLLSFINTTTTTNQKNTDSDISVQEDEVAVDREEEVMEMEEDQEEEEVEVVDRGTMVEVKVSGGAAAMKVHRSSIVINKFVSFMLPTENEKGHHHRHQEDETANYPTTTATTKRTTTSTTTAAAAAVAAASSLSTFPADGNERRFDNKMLFTSKRRNKEELLRNMRRCSQLRKPLFIWEPCCIATTST